MSLKISVMFFVIFILLSSQSWPGEDCPQGSLLLFQHGSDPEPLRVCSHSRLFFFKGINSQEYIEVPVVGFSDEPTVYDLVLNELGEETTVNNFKPLYQQALSNYVDGLQNRVMNTMVSDQVMALDYLNSGTFATSATKCQDFRDMSEVFMKGMLARDGQLRCRVSTKDLPQDLVENIDMSEMVTGKVSLRAILAKNPQLTLKMRSRLGGREKLLQKDTMISLTDFLSFELSIEGESGDQAVLGHCLDYSERLFNFDFNQDNPDVFNDIYNSRWTDDSLNSQEDGFSARLTDTWRIPFSVDMDHRLIRDESGERIDSMDFGLNTGLLYEKQYNSGHRIRVRPEVGIPLIEGVTNPNDVLSGNGLTSPIPNVLKLNISVHW